MPLAIILLSAYCFYNLLKNKMGYISRFFVNNIFFGRLPDL